MSIFVLNKTNIEFLKNVSDETALSKIGNAPYWKIDGRLCIHYAETPQFILHHRIPIDASHASFFDDYLHVTNLKKPLYAITHYSIAELSDMSTRLHLPLSTKREMYENISKIMMIFKKN